MPELSSILFRLNVLLVVLPPPLAGYAWLAKRKCMQRTIEFAHCRGEGGGRDAERVFSRLVAGAKNGCRFLSLDFVYFRDAANNARE